MKDLNSMLVRQGEDDFDAICIAEVMQSMPHVDVVSIVHQQVPKLTDQHTGQVWHVFAKYDDYIVTTDQIDTEISKMYEDRDEQLRQIRAQV